MTTPDPFHRSLRLTTSTRRVLGNRLNQSLSALDWSSVDEGGGGGGGVVVGKGGPTTEPKPKMTAKDLPGAPPSPAKSPSQPLHTTGTASFWAEWADEMNIKNAENDQGVATAAAKASSPSQPAAPPSGGGGDHSEANNSRVSLFSKSFSGTTNTAASPPRMAHQLVMNSSMTSLSVMNISVGTVRSSLDGGGGGGAGGHDGDLELLYDAMADSVAAQTLLEAKKYRESMIIYRKAIKAYVKVFDDENRVVAGVNAASCYRNMSTAARLLKQHSEAAECINRAIAWYLKSHALVTEQSKQSVVTLDGKCIDDSQCSPNQSVSSLTDSVCIDSMLMEALHAQAAFYVDIGPNVAGAFGAHDQALSHLVDIDRLAQWKAPTTTLLCRDGVVFTAPTKEQQTKWLLTSLRELGSYFLKHDQFADTPLGLFEKGIDIVQNRFEGHEIKDNATIHELASVMRLLSEVYFVRHHHDLAADALHDSASIKLRALGEPSAEALRILEKVGAANERAECYDKARSCYEQIMVARSKFYGTTHPTVAKALFDVGRVIEKKNNGPTAESVEILRTANSVLAIDLTEGKPELRENMDAIMQLLPTIQHLDRTNQVVNDLDRSLSELSMHDLYNKQGPFDKAQIYFDLGRGFMLANNSQLAVSCLNEAMKEAKSCAQNDQAEDLLKSMHVLEEKESGDDLGSSLAGEAIELGESPQKAPPVTTNIDTTTAVTEHPAPKMVTFGSHESLFSEAVYAGLDASVSGTVNSGLDGSVFDPSMHIFEDPPTENVLCHQPIIRNHHQPPIMLNHQRYSTVSTPPKSHPRSSIAQPPLKAATKKTVSNPVQQQLEKPSWRRLFCNMCAPTTKPVERNLTEKSSGGHESLVPIIGSQTKGKPQAATTAKHRSNTTGRTKVGTKLFTIPEINSPAHENQGRSTQHLLDTSIQSQETVQHRPVISSSTMGGAKTQKPLMSYSTMGRKHYAAV